MPAVLPGHTRHDLWYCGTSLCRYRCGGAVKGRSQRRLEVEESKETGIWHFAKNYVLSLAAVLTLGFLLLVSLLVSAGLAAAGKYASTCLPEGLLQMVSTMISFAVVTVLFAMMFKWLPDVSVRWGDVWLGAVLTAILFAIGKAAIGLYIGKQGLESTYGAAAAIVVVLIWVITRRRSS